MITFADLVLLLLAFFVLLFSMSHVKTENWQAVVEALSRRLNPESLRVKIEPASERNIARMSVPKLVDLDYLSTVLGEKISADPVLARSIIQRLDDRLVISLPGDAVFEPGSAELAAGARQAAFGLGELLHRLGNRIDINGHTDSEPVRSGAFVSNWELSLARALALAGALREAGLGQRITAFGLADSRFFHISPALSPTRRQELARRVDIVIRETASMRGRDDY